MATDHNIAQSNASRILDTHAQEILFTQARTYNGWTDQDVSDDQLRAIYDLTKFAPTSANCSPMRVIFVKSQEQKERLKPFLAEGNLDKTMGAPVTAIFAFDKEFYEHLPQLFPHTDAKSWFVGNDAMIEETAWRNGTLQAGYMIMAIRALGLDTGAMSGFDREGVQKEFFPEGNVEVNFLCNIGYGDSESLFPRSPRFTFDEVCQIL